MANSRGVLYINLYFWLIPTVVITLGMVACLLDTDYFKNNPLSAFLDRVSWYIAGMYALGMLAIIIQGVQKQRLPFKACLLAVFHILLLVGVFGLAIFPFIFVTFVFHGGEFYGISRASGWPIPLIYYLLCFGIWYGISGRFLRKMLCRAVIPVGKYST